MTTSKGCCICGHDAHGTLATRADEHVRLVYVPVRKRAGVITDDVSEDWVAYLRTVSLWLGSVSVQGATAPARAL
jgi:hypothetical protein